MKDVIKIYYHSEIIRKYTSGNTHIHIQNFTSDVRFQELLLDQFFRIF